jgi:hypothetical protein
MTAKDAHALLDAVRDGEDAPLFEINRALALTGDKTMTKTKTKIELTCEAVSKIGSKATVAQVAEVLGLPLQTTRDRLKNARTCGWLQSDGGYLQSYALSATYLALEKTRARIDEIRKTGELVAFETNPERAAAVIEALGVAGGWEVQQALETGASNASQFVAVALSRGWIARSTDGGIRKYAATPAWRDHVAGVQESRAEAASDPAERLEVEYVGMPKMRGPLAKTVWRACFAVAA